MNSRASGLIAAIAVMLMSQMAQAEPVKVWGAGAESCETLQANSQSVEIELKQWLLGFVSAHNYYTGQQQVQLPEAKVDAAYAHVSRYCQRYPSHGVTAAAASYIKSLGGQASSPAAEEISRGETRAPG